MDEQLPPMDLDAAWRHMVQKHTSGGACNFRDAALEFAAEAAKQERERYDELFAAYTDVCVESAQLKAAACWQPIETAPKDGTDILVCFDCATVLVAHIAWWRSTEDSPEFTDEDVGWWSYVRGSVTQEKLEGYRAPTHWMPFHPPGEHTKA